ncbi:DUF805 domain-containing protein [Ligilactobacillus salivarius]|uniref:DUF805 domain-containing protein n=1 Tax=Ligilactobacillus salivarius TaxID=1624 RepID=UPI003D775353
MFCTKCGAKNPEDATFCYKCGNEMYADKTKSMAADPSVTTDEVVAKGINPLVDFWTNIVNFEGKMSRHNFWVAVFVMALINLVIVALVYDTEAMLLWWFYDLFFLIATISASVRRLHDINKSGAYILLNLIPLVGQVILLIMLLQEGSRYTRVSSIKPFKKNIGNRERILISFGIIVVFYIIGIVLLKLIALIN